MPAKNATVYTYVDCHTDSVAARALNGMGAQGSMMTVDYFARVCAGFTYIAPEYGGEYGSSKACSPWLH